MTTEPIATFAGRGLNTAFNGTRRLDGLVETRLTPTAPERSSIFSELLTPVKEAKQKGVNIKKSSFTYPEYLVLVENNPSLRIRNIAQYAVNAIDYADRYFGGGTFRTKRVLGEELRAFQFLKKSWQSPFLRNREMIHGQLLFWNKFYNHLVEFSKMRNPNRMLIGHGPHSTGKSVGFDAFVRLLEWYSKTDEGALYTFRIEFDDKSPEFGFTSQNGTSNDNVWSIDKDQITLSLPSNMNSIPFFLIPKEERVKLLEELGINREIDNLNLDFLCSFEIDPFSIEICKRLKERVYDDDFLKVLKHIRVIRRDFSSQGLIIKQAGEQPNATLIPHNSPIEWGRLPRPYAVALEHAELYSVSGLDANHGVVLYDDFPTGTHLHEIQSLLRPVEHGRTSVSTDHRFPEQKTMEVMIDTLYIGAANDPSLHNFASDHPDTYSKFKGRMAAHPIGYERCYRDVASLFEEKLINMIPPNRHVSPQFLETFALWAAMTTIFPPLQNKNYYDSLDISERNKLRLKELLSKLDPLRTALLYQGEGLNDNEIETEKLMFSTEDERFLHANAKYRREEYNLGVGEHNFYFYEGKFGLAPRDAEIILAKAARLKVGECLSAIELFNVLEEQIKHGFEFEINRDAIAAQYNSDKHSGLTKLSIPSKFPSTRELLELAKEHVKRQVRYHISKVTGSIKSKEELGEDLKKYVFHVTAKLNNTSVPQEYGQPKRSTEPSEDFMKQQEDIFGVQDSERGNFRNKIMDGIINWSPGEEIENKNAIDNLDKIFLGLISKLEAKYVQENRQRIKLFLEDLQACLESEGDISQVSTIQNFPARGELLLQGIEGLQELGYCRDCIRKLVPYACKDWQ